MYNTFLLGFSAHFCLVFLFSVRYRSMIHKYVLKYVVNSLCHADKKKSTSKMYSLICCSLWFLTCYVPISSKHFVITLCIILYSVLRRSMPYLTLKECLQAYYIVPAIFIYFGFIGLCRQSIPTCYCHCCYTAA